MTIPTALESQQRLAADPARSAWVTANAGSGKTHVLVQRVLRLLLDGVDPARLLCLTFTNAAAAQMADRISLSLGHWAVADDEKLAGILHDILGRPAKQHEQARARRLFAQAIETPGRLKIQTIHAFCERVLQLFPFEAGVPAGFDVLDDLEARRLTDAALGEILTEAEADRDSEAAALLDDILARSGEHAMRDALAKLISRRGRYLAWRRNGGTAHRYLGIDRRLTADDIVRSFAASSRVMASGWGDVCEALLGDAGTAMQKLGSTFQQAAGDTLAQARCVIAAYFTQQNLPLANFPAKSLQKSAPALYAAFDADRGAAIAAKDRVLAVELAASSEALFGFADKVLAAYARLKAEASALDFDDLIGRMEALLANGHGPWVLYRLDRGIDHILVDEAQDTSPEQWRIVRALAEEFFAGEGASGKVRTIFAVGDEKQSIYSFQGADPQGFREMKSLFRRRVDQAGLAFSAVALTHSFRSTPEILASVDAVFALDDAARGVAERDANGSALGLGHVAIHDAQAGVVELWPPVPARQKDEKEAWDAPLDRDDETHNTVILAKAIAGKIKALIDAGTILPSTGRNGSSRAAGEGDFLILLRKRTRLARPIVKALKDAGLRVAGADRLRIAEHIAVEDLIGLGTLCWLPDDDLTLAAVLKSPLFGLGEDDIYRLAVDRTGSLHDALAASPDERHRDAYRRLDAFRAKGRAARPFDFYADVLGAGGGRDAIHARMGMEALDPVDEFLSLALSYEQAHAATLPGFVAWIAEG
ncbi:MAG: UvrD-helicase domain-containing protein, partial [Flavobacteriaceae bacterium]